MLLVLLIWCFLVIVRISAQTTVVNSLYSTLRSGWCEGASVDSITPEEIYCVQPSTCCGANFVVSRIHTANGSIIFNYSLQGQYSGTTAITTSIDRFSSQMWVVSGDQDSAIISISLGNTQPSTYVDASFVEGTTLVGASKLVFDVGFLQGYWFYILTGSPRRVAVCSHWTGDYSYDLQAPHNLSRAFTPVDMAYDGNTGLYVLDAANGVVVQYYTVSNAVTSTINVTRDNGTSITSPTCLAVDSFGNLYVSHSNADGHHNFVAVYDLYGNVTYVLYSVPALSAYQLLVDSTPSLVISNVGSSTAQPYALVRLTNLPDAPYITQAASISYFLLPLSTAQWASSSTSAQCPTLQIHLSGGRFDSQSTTQPIVHWWADNGTEISSAVQHKVLSLGPNDLVVCITSFPSSYIMEGKPFNIRNVSASVQVFNFGSTASLASNVVVVALARMDLSIADETMRWRLLLWSFISYGGIGAQLNTRWDCSICSLFSTAAEVVQRAVFNDDSAHSFAIMGMTNLASSSPTWQGTASTAAYPLALNNAIIVAFRGTDGSLFTPQDFLTDADVYPVLLGNHICPTCTFVRQGFYTKAMNLITTNGLGAAFIVLLADNPNANIFVAGHSLGGALASQFAMWVIDYLHTNNLFRAQVGLYTFGQPPVGDASYTLCLQSNLPAIHRQIHFQDPVPNAFATVFFSTLLVLANAALEFPALSAVLLTCPQLINVDNHTDVVYSYAESLGDMVAFPYPRFSLAPNTTCLSSSDVRCHGSSPFRLFFTDYGVAFHRLGYFGVQLLDVSFYASCPLPCLSGSTCPMRITAAQLPGTISCSCDFSQYFTEGTQDETISYLRYKTPNCEDEYPGPPAVLHTWPTSTPPQPPVSALVGSPPVSLHLMDQELTPSWDPTLTLQTVAAACGVPNQRVVLLGAIAGSVLATFQILIDPTVDVDANGTFMSLTSLLVASSTPGELQQLVNAQPWAAPPLALFLDQIAARSFNVSGEVVNASQVALLPPVGDPVLVDIQPRVLPAPNTNPTGVVVLTLSGSGFLPPNSSQEGSAVFQAPTVLNALQAPELLLQNTVPPANASTPSVCMGLSNITRVNDSTLLVTVLLSIFTPNVSYTFTLSRENATLSQSLQATFTQQTPIPMVLSSSASLSSTTIPPSSSSALVSSSSVGADTGSTLLTPLPHTVTSSFMPSAIASLSSANPTSSSRFTTSSTAATSPSSCLLALTSSFSYSIHPMTSSFSTAEDDSRGSSGGSENGGSASSTGAAVGGSTPSSPSVPLNIILPVVLGSAGLACFLIIACRISARNSRKRGSERTGKEWQRKSIEMVEVKAPYEQ